MYSLTPPKSWGDTEGFVNMKSSHLSEGKSLNSTAISPYLGNTCANDTDTFG